MTDKEKEMLETKVNRELSKILCDVLLSSGNVPEGAKNCIKLMQLGTELSNYICDSVHEIVPNPPDIGNQDHIKATIEYLTLVKAGAEAFFDGLKEDKKND